MGNIGNNIVYKKICLEPFKSRIPGLISSINESETDTNKGNWGEIPYDLKLDEIEGLDALKEYMLSKHYGAIKVKCTTVDGEKTMESNVPEWYEKLLDLPEEEKKEKRPISYVLQLEEPRLRYRDLMLWYYKIIDICAKSPIYEWSRNNADVSNTNGYWVDMDNFNIFNTDITDITNVVSEFKQEEWDNTSVYIVVTPEDKEFFDNHSGFELISFVQTIIGRLNVPTSIKGSKVPNFIYYSEIQDMLDEMDKIKNATDCCLRSNYEEMGGDNMFTFLDTYAGTFETYADEFKNHNLIPYVDIPLTITCDIEDLGVMFNDEQEWIAGNKYEIGDIVTYNGDTYKAKNTNSGVYSSKYDEVFFDILDSNDNIRLTNWEEYVDLTNFQINKNVTGEAVSQLKSFRTTRKTYADSGFELDGVLPYVEGTTNLVKNESGYVELLLPFMIGVPLSVVTDEDGNKYGDVLYSVTEEGNVLRFKYVISGKLNDDESYTVNLNNGIHYEEAYIYSWQEVRDTIDDKPIKMKYKQVNYSLNVDNGSTFPILSKVSYKAQDVWNNDAAITVPTFRKDYLIGMAEYPSEDVDVIIDRGLSHAFEKHLMLTETNTFNDLKNYKNNYFNLQ